MNSSLRFLALVAALIVVCGMVSQSSQSRDIFASSPLSFSGQIKHIVVIMQENHSFDNFFETFPGVLSSYVAPLTTCIPKEIGNPGAGCNKIFNGDHNIANIWSANLPHDYASEEKAYDSGAMDGFVNATPRSYQFAVMAYFTGKVIPVEWDYASAFALDANFYSGLPTYSYPNHVESMTANPNLFNDPKRAVYFNLTTSSIFDELTASGISWATYAGQSDSLQCQNLTTLNGGSNFTQTGSIEPSYEEYWNTAQDFPSLQDNPSTCHDIKSVPDFFSMVQTGSLPQVSWITPQNFSVSDHPHGSSLNASELYVSAIINDVEESPYWSSTAIFLTYDEMGGWYDNLPPPQVDSIGYGFRVPLIVISPYVKTGVYYGPGNQPEDFAAILSTIESAFGLPPLSSRDGGEAPLWYMFNFKEMPRNPLFIKYGTVPTYPVASCIKSGFCSRTVSFPEPPALQQGSKYSILPPSEIDPPGFDGD